MDMETVIPIGAALFLIVLACLLARITIKEWKKRAFVYPKTGNLYMPLYRCRMKNPISGEWFDAIIYKGVEDNKYYVRERKDFLDKFIKLNEWNNGTRY